MESPSRHCNLLLDCLSLETQKTLFVDLRLQHVRQLQPVIEPGVEAASVLFPVSCVFSVVSRASDIQTLETAIIGREGVVALSLFGGQRNTTTTVVAQVEGEVLLMPRAAFVGHLRNVEFLEAIARYWDSLYALTCQSAACQAFHTTEQRLARWLLLIHDRVEGDELLLTQDFMASMMGVQRPTVTIAARILQAADLIRYRYGRITITDRAGLEDASCDCYRRLSCGPTKTRALD